jgi:hypothetical protein
MDEEMVGLLKKALVHNSSQKIEQRKAYALYNSGNYVSRGE